jgi:hypothetical protein
MADLLDEAEPFDNLEVAAPKRGKTGGTEAEIQLPEPEESFDPEPSDEDLGELIDGGEDDISDLEESDANIGAVEDCAPAVSAAVKAVAAAAKRKKSDSMAETKTHTKAEMIRDEIARRKAKGEDSIRPRDVIATLGLKGITVAAPQVSVALRDFDKPKAEKKIKAAPAARAEKKVKEPKRVLAKVNAATAPKVKKAVGGPLRPEELATVGKFVRAYASPNAAIDAIQAYAEYTAALNG